MSGFTPGPWTNDGAEIYAPSHEWVAESLNVKDYPRSYANARLIASAPDLYEALEGLLQDALDAHDAADWVDCAFLDAARAALAKAEGRPSTQVVGGA